MYEAHVCTGSPLVKTAFPVQGIWVQFLVGELRSHMLHRTAKNYIKSEKNKRRYMCDEPLEKVLGEHSVSHSVMSNPL